MLLFLWDPMFPVPQASRLVICCKGLSLLLPRLLSQGKQKEALRVKGGFDLVLNLGDPTGNWMALWSSPEQTQTWLPPGESCLSPLTPSTV